MLTDNEVERVTEAYRAGVVGYFDHLVSRLEKRLDFDSEDRDFIMDFLHEHRLNGFDIANGAKKFLRGQHPPKPRVLQGHKLSIFEGRRLYRVVNGNVQVAFEGENQLPDEFTEWITADAIPTRDVPIVNSLLEFPLESE